MENTKHLSLAGGFLTSPSIGVSLIVGFTINGQPDLAIQDFNEAIRQKPDFTEAYYNRGAVYGTKGKTDLAIKDFEKSRVFG